MKVSVVICTYDIYRSSDTLSSINSVLSQTYKDFELVVVVDRNEELLEFLKKEVTSPKILILFSKEAGLSACRNFALNHTQGDVVAFLDDDAVADKEWLQYLANSYDDDAIMSVGGKIVPHPGTPIPNFIPKEMYWIFGCTYQGHPTDKREVRNTFGSNISFRRGVFNQLGAFECGFGRVDKKNITAEETELCIRIRKSNPKFKIIYEPRAVVYHRIYKSRLSLDYVLRRGFGEGYSKALVNKKYKNNGVLSVEKRTLSDLLRISIPGRLKEVTTGKNVINNFNQTIFLLLISASVLIGFLDGTRLNRRIRI